MRSDKRFKEAIKPHKQKGRKTEANTLFKTLAEAYNYREYDLYSYTKQLNKKENHLSIGARISQQLAKRVFGAVKEYQFKKRRRPRFKSQRDINSLETILYTI
jgi:hypothetical protein